jgi:sulfur carrier protein
MQITINGQKRASEAATLGELWRTETQHLEAPGPRGFAIALNGKVVRKDDWARTPIAEGDRIEIIRALPGG